MANDMGAAVTVYWQPVVFSTFSTQPELAKKAGVTPRYVKNILRAAMLSPDGVEAILAGKCSPELTLTGLVNELPGVWASQSDVLI